MPRPRGLRGTALLSRECRKLFREDIAEEVPAGSAANGPGGPEERDVDGGEPPRNKKKNVYLKRCVATAKAMGAGVDEEESTGEDDLSW